MCDVFLFYPCRHSKLQTKGTNKYKTHSIGSTYPFMSHHVIYKHYKCKSKQDKWVDMRSVTSSLSGNIPFRMFRQSFWRSYWTNWPLQDNSIWLMMKYFKRMAVFWKKQNSLWPVLWFGCLSLMCWHSHKTSIIFIRNLDQPFFTGQVYVCAGSTGRKCGNPVPKRGFPTKEEPF